MSSTLPTELQQAAERYLTSEFVTIDATGRGMAGAPMVLVQGTARVDDTDLDANRERYEREMADKLPALHALAPTGALKRFFSWYYDRIYLHVRPERVYVWAGAALDAEPTLYDA